MSYVEVDKLAVLIEAQASQYKREMAELQRLTQKTSSKMTGSLLKANVASQILVGTFRKVGNATFNMGKQLVNLGSQYSRLKIATDTVTRNMGMSIEQVNDLRTALEETNTYGSQAENAIKTLALSGLIDMAKSLKFVDARSGETVEGVNALVLAMKDLGAAAGIDSAQAIDRVTNFVRRGNVALADGLIEVGNLANEYKAYAKTLGKTYTELTQQELAQARLNIVMREAEKTLGAYANTMQTSGKAMDSIKNATTSLFERLGNYLEPVFASVTRAIFEFVNSVRSALIGNEMAFRDWANKVAAYVVAVVRILGTLLTRIPVVGKHFENLTHFSLKPVVSTMSKLSEGASGSASAMDEASGSAKKLKKELLGLAGFDEMNVLSQKEGGGTIGGGINVGGAGIDMGELMDVESLNESINEINDMADELERGLREKLGKIKEALKPLMDFLKPIGKWFWENKGIILKVAGAFLLVKIAVEKVIGIFAIFGGIATIASTVAGAIGGIVSIIGSLVASGAIVPILIGALIALIAYAAYWTIKHWDEVKERFSEIWASIQDTFEKVSKKITEIWEMVTDWIKDKWEALGRWWSEGIEGWGLIFSWLGDWIKNIWGSVTGWIGGKWDNTTNLIKGGIDRLHNWFSGFWNNVKGMASDAWEGIKKPFGNAASWFKNIFTNAWQGVKNVFSSGGAIFNGIKDGIANTFKGVVNSLIGGINTVVSIPFGAINSALTTIRNTSIAGLRPFKWLPSIYAPRIPYLAKGGVIESPTMAVLGESGREAVIPLEDSNWIDELADKIGGSGQPINLTVKLGEDTIYKGFVDYLNDRSLASNSKLLRI